MKEQVSQSLAIGKIPLAGLVDYILSSIFYFELEDYPTYTNSAYDCAGYILCRLDLPVRGRRFLYQRLSETSSLFIVQGRTVRCVQSVPESTPPFKQRVRFVVQSLGASIAISIRGLTSTTRLISGFPTSARRLIEAQELDCPFGTASHSVPEKALPSIPCKRKSSARNLGKRSRHAAPPGFI